MPTKRPDDDQGTIAGSPTLPAAGLTNADIVMSDQAAVESVPAHAGLAEVGPAGPVSGSSAASVPSVAGPQDPAYQYRVIERALDLIASPDGASLSLDDLAGRMHMSPAHFQRMFSAWAGVSPKRYQQFLTLDLARRLLEERHTLLDTAVESGLSGTGRLHDLFLSWEAMSPGEYARAGAGLTIRYGWFPSPFGEALAMATPRGLCGMAFVQGGARDAAYHDMTSRWPRASFVHDPDALSAQVAAAFSQTGRTTLHMIGAPFQIKVWEALLAVPEGHVTTYSDIARRIGHPTAIRAVGSAVGRNPISWLIPCHRALRKTGALGGYHWGLQRKRAMLAWEAARTAAE